MAVTIKDIAKKVGRSVTTVSRALNDYDDVSPQTKEIVRRTALELGYTPNILAQRLQKRRSDTIGFVIPTYGPRFSDPFFSEFLAGVGNRAAAFGYDLLVSTRPPGDEEIENYQQIVRGGRVDGFIILRTRQDDPRIRYLCEVEFPFVSFGRSNIDLEFPFVDEDSTHGIHLVAEHLLGLGHTRIACITPPMNLMFARFRSEAFREALARVNLPLPEVYIQEGDLTQRSGFFAAGTLLDLPEPPTAIVACNDLMALGAISAARERGLTIGKDLSITGFDDIPLAEHAHPPLTTVHQPIYEIGGRACQMLIELIQNGVIAERRTLLKPSLVIRKSTGRPLA